MSRLIIERQRGDYEAVSVLHAAVKLSSPAHNYSKWSSCKQLIISLCFSVSLSPTQGLKLRSGVVASHREWRISYFFSVISLHNFYCQNKFHMQKFFSFFDSFVSKDVKMVRYKRNVLGLTNSGLALSVSFMFLSKYIQLHCAQDSVYQSINQIIANK